MFPPATGTDIGAGIPTAPPVDAPPPDPNADPSAAPNPLITLEVTPEFIDKMFKEVQMAEGRRKLYEGEWDILLKSYVPNVTEMGTPEEVKTNIQFRNVHSKLSQVFYQNPELYLEPKSPMKDPIGMNPQTGAPITSEDALAMKREVLNDKLGDDGVCAAWTMDEILLDCLLWAGHGVAEVGYLPTMKSFKEPIMIPDPHFVPQQQPGQVLGLGAPAQQAPMVPLMGRDGQPVMRDVQVAIYEDWFFKRLSPKKALISVDLRSSRIEEEACWVGKDLFMTKEQIKRVYNFDTDATPAAVDDRVGANTKEDSAKSEAKKFHLYEMWIRACEYDPNQPHPQALYQLVLMEGVKDRVLVYRPCVHQTFDERGKLTVDSIDSFPIKFCSLRDFPDSPFVHSDAAFVHSEAKVLNTSRRQSVRLRDAAISKMLYDEDAFTAEEIERFRNMKVGDFLAVKAGLLSAGKDTIMTPASQPTRTRDDDTLERSVKQDIDEALGVSASDAGVLDDGGAKTATEVTNASTKAGARLAKDRQRAARFYLRCVRHYDILLIRYATAEEYVSFLGKQGEQRMEMWNGKMFNVRWSYGMKLDSQLIMDVARERQQLLTYMEKTMQDPTINRYPIHKKLARSFGLDPVEVLVNPAQLQANAMGGNTQDPQGAATAQGQAQSPPSPEQNNVLQPLNPPRPHVATGGRPNQPDFGAHPNSPRPRA